MTAIGGYFELELQKTEEYHNGAIRLNTGRNALEYILLANKYRKIYIPYFTCDVLLQPIKRNNIKYEFYNIDINFEPVFDFSSVEQNSAFLYTNYFGLKDGYLIKICELCKNLIIDNAQSFYSKPLKNIDTFYSARKFFGVSDGAYLYTKNRIDFAIEKDVSFRRVEHLLKRIDLSAEEGFSDFQENEKLLDNQSILEMSNLTERLLKSINYKNNADIRIHNFRVLNDLLSKINHLSFNLDENCVPFVYPFLSNKRNLRKKLIANRVYVATYWPNVLTWVDENSIEHKYTEQIIYLPIDQRIDKEKLELLIKIIKHNG